MSLTMPVGHADRTDVDQAVVRRLPCVERVGRTHDLGVDDGVDRHDAQVVRAEELQAVPAARHRVGADRAAALDLDVERLAGDGGDVDGLAVERRLDVADGVEIAELAEVLGQHQPLFEPVVDRRPERPMVDSAAVCASSRHGHNPPCAGGDERASPGRPGTSVIESCNLPLYRPPSTRPAAQSRPRDGLPVANCPGRRFDRLRRSRRTCRGIRPALRRRRRPGHNGPSRRKRDEPGRGPESRCKFRCCPARPSGSPRA